MINPDICLDYYRESLKVGDFIVPIYDKVNELGIKGTITKIDYIPEQDKHFLTIMGEDGNIYDRIWYSRCFSTPERKDIRDNKDYVYSLAFYNNKFKRIGHLPLTNISDINYTIPNNTSFASIDADHLEEKGRQLKKQTILTCYSYMVLYYFIINNDLELADLEHRNGPVLISKDVMFPRPIGHNYKLFDNKEDLANYIKEIIKYFNEADLKNINNNKEFRKNKIGQEFEDNLVLKLKK